MNRILLLTALIVAGWVLAKGQELELPRHGGVLSGTLLQVGDEAGTRPLIIFVSGSGPTDRDGNQGGVGSNAIGLLADSMATWGISSFRYDKRAVGKSAFPDLREETLLQDTFVADLEAWVQHFAADGRWHPILIAGHSEGALHAKMAALRQPAVRGVISLCGAGRPIDQLLLEQMQRHPPFIGQAADSLFQLLKEGKPFDTPMYLHGLLRPSVQPYMRAWMAIDPAALIRDLDIPTLIVGGDKDLQVPASDAEILHAAARQGELLIALNMNHVFRATSTEVDNFASYQQPERPIWRGLAYNIASWVDRHFKD